MIIQCFNIYIYINQFTFNGFDVENGEYSLALHKSFHKILSIYFK